MLKIRSFQPPDGEAVRHLFAQTHLDLVQGSELEEEIRSFIQDSLSDDLSDITRHYLDSPGDHFWVAEIDGQVKGTAGIKRRDNGEAELLRVTVAVDSRRQGIGGRLLKTAEDFCLGHPYQRIHLTTATHMKSAIALYQKTGYRLMGEGLYGQYSRIVALHFVKYLSDPLISVSAPQKSVSLPVTV